MNDRLQKQLNFILEVDKSKGVGRQTYILDAKRKENDAEHAWHIALMAYLLREYSDEQIDITKVMVMLLIHDLVEIDADDTYAYDESGNNTKRERELKAAERIFNLLPKDQAKEIYDLWEEFESIQTPESKYANALDKLQPIMLNDKSNGLAWREHKVHASQVSKRVSNINDISTEFSDVINNIIEKNTYNKNLLND